MHALSQPITVLLVPLLTFLFHLAQDWGIAVLLLTLFVRLLLFPFSLRVARQQALQMKIQPELVSLRERYKDKPADLMMETRKIYEKYGVKPMAMFTIALLQMPIFMGMYSLFITHGATMSSFLIPWVLTFAESDPWHVLPIAAASLACLTSFLPLSPSVGTTVSNRQRILTALLMVPFFLLVLWKAPVALCLYWIAGSMFGLLERLFYRTVWGQSLLNRKMRVQA